jgi:hypothetical protein
MHTREYAVKIQEVCPYLIYSQVDSLIYHTFGIKLLSCLNTPINTMKSNMAQEKADLPSVDEIIKGIKDQPGYEAHIVLNNEGIVIHFDQAEKDGEMTYVKAVHYAGHILPLYKKTRACMEQLKELKLSETGVVEKIVLRTQDKEVIVAQHGQYTLLVICNDTL